jgi:DNA replication protein DnaC
MTEPEYKPMSIEKRLGVSSMDNTFDNMKPNPGNEQALKYAREIATLKTPWHLLMIYGDYGNGKTRLLEGISIELYKQGIFNHIQLFPDFIDRLKDSFDRNKADVSDPTYNMIMASACKTPYLLMDDVGLAGSFTEFSRERLERITLERYRYNLFTVMTTNRDLKELPPAVLSRFNDKEKARLVQNKGLDYRPLKIGGK